MRTCCFPLKTVGHAAQASAKNKCPLSFGRRHGAKKSAISLNDPLFFHPTFFFRFLHWECQSLPAPRTKVSDLIPKRWDHPNDLGHPFNPGRHSIFAVQDSVRANIVLRFVLGSRHPITDPPINHRPPPIQIEITCCNVIFTLQQVVFTLKQVISILMGGVGD